MLCFVALRFVALCCVVSCFVLLLLLLRLWLLLPWLCQPICMHTAILPTYAQVLKRHIMDMNTLTIHARFLSKQRIIVSAAFCALGYLGFSRDCPMVGVQAWLVQVTLALQFVPKRALQ